MKTIPIALAALALAAVRANAAVIATDLFNDPSYSPGGNIYPNSNQDTGNGYGVGPDDGTGFTSGWVNPFYTSPRTVVSGLAYAGLATSGYGAASPAYVTCSYCVNSTAIRTFSDNTATTDLWVSFLIEEQGITAQDFSTYSNYGGIAIEDAAGDSVYVGVPGLTTPTADYSLQTFYDMHTSTGVAQSAVAARSGATVLLVADITDTGEAYLYVDPTVGGALGAPDASIAAPFTPTGATELYWSDSWGWTYGDVRVGTTLADVTPAPSPVPEPATWSLTLVGFACLGRALRARGKSVPGAA